MRTHGPFGIPIPPDLLVVTFIIYVIMFNADLIRSKRWEDDWDWFHFYRESVITNMMLAAWAVALGITMACLEGPDKRNVIASLQNVASIPFVLVALGGAAIYSALPLEGDDLRYTGKVIIFVCVWGGVLLSIGWEGGGD